ncbi:hypothetical protein AMTRI_Chr09g12870 [Amborella trichopoda]
MHLREKQLCPSPSPFNFPETRPKAFGLSPSMAMIGPVVEVASKYVCDPLAHQITYFAKLRENLEVLMRATDELMSRRDDKQREAEEAIRVGKVPTAQLTEWLEAVRRIEAKARVIKEEYEQGKSCLRTNCWSRYRLGKRAVKLRIEVDHRYQATFEKLATTPPPESAVVFEGVPPIDDQPTTLSTLQQLLDCMNDEEVKVVGVYGMGGIGKTTLAKKVYNQLSSQSLFDTVIWIKVSENLTSLSIQKMIVSKLGHSLQSKLPQTLQEDNIEVVRDTLLGILRKKQALIILDDVWEPLVLGDLGIPLVNNEGGCKVLLTTRNLNVCTSMEADQKIHVRKLVEEEAWNLFQKKTSPSIADPLIEPIAKTVIKKCDGLPLAIITLARAMANRHTVQEWEDAARELEHSASRLQGMIRDVFIPLKFSYDRLDDEDARSLFLYCALFPEDHSIREDQITCYCIGEGFIDSLGNIRAARNKGHTLVGSLKIACMLQNGDYENSVKVHDVMRELAIWITSTGSGHGPKHIVRSRVGLREELITAEEWKEASRISLMCNNLRQLPELPQCRQLVTLLLNQNRYLDAIPTNLSECMKALSVFDLSETKITSLPCSQLASLRVLHLRLCRNLKELPATIGELNKLQLLNLSGCDRIKELPIGLGKLVNLRHLNLNWTASLERIPSGVFSGLLNLEELLMEGSRLRLHTDETPLRANVIELTSLTRLTTLEITIQDVSSWSWLERLSTSIHSLRLIRCTNTNDGLIALAESRSTRYLSFENCKNLKHVSTCCSEFLEHLRVKACGELKSVVVIEEARESAFHRLEKLNLHYLPMLNKICTGELPQGCFASLKRMEIECCPSLRVLFTNGMPQLLKRLEYLEVLDCDKLEKIIAEEGEQVPADAFPNLHKVYLWELPKLTTICDRALIWPSLKHLTIDRCPKLNKLPFGVCGAQNLNDIWMEECAELEGAMVEFQSSEASLLENLPGLERTCVGRCFANLQNLGLRSLQRLERFFVGNPPQGCFSNLLKIDVMSCQRLQVLLPKGMTRLLKNLETVEVWNCEEMEMIIEEVLRCLRFGGLPKLTTLCNRVLKWSSLEYLEIGECLELKKLPFAVGTAQRLQKISVHGREWWEGLEWRDPNILNSLPKPIFSERETQDE